jgi:hypothetical protein
MLPLLLLLPPLPHKPLLKPRHLLLQLLLRPLQLHKLLLKPPLPRLRLHKPLLKLLLRLLPLHKLPPKHRLLQTLPPLQLHKLPLKPLLRLLQLPKPLLKLQQWLLKPHVTPHWPLKQLPRQHKLLLKQLLPLSRLSLLQLASPI